MTLIQEIRVFRERLRRRQTTDAELIAKIDEWLTVEEGVSQRANKIARDLETLTESERKILDLLGENLSRIQIAERLKIAAKTLDAHRDNMRKKLGITSGIQLKQFAESLKQKES